MVILDVAVVNVALPSIKTDLNFSDESLQWVVSAYAIFFGGALLLGGRLADLLGRRRLFVGGLLLFAASSLLCGIAWSEASLIGFRALQGLGGALLAPAALSLLMTTFAEGRERNLALGIYGAASGSGAAAGVLLGGVLTQLSQLVVDLLRQRPGRDRGGRCSYRCCWRRAVPELGHRHFDARGAVTATAGLMLLVYALTRATTEGWTSTAALLPLVGSFSLLGGVRRARAPLALAAPAAATVPRSVARCRERRRWQSSAQWRSPSSSCSRCICRTSLRYSAMQGGVAFVAFAGTVVVVSNLAQLIVARIGARATLTAGLLTSALSVALLIRLPVDGQYFWDLFPAFVLGGAGMGLSFVPVTILGLAGVARADAGVASGLINTSRQIGGAIGIAARQRDRRSSDQPLQRRPRLEPRRARPRLPDCPRRSDRATAARSRRRRPLRPHSRHRGRADLRSARAGAARRGRLRCPTSQKQGP